MTTAAVALEEQRAAPETVAAAEASVAALPGSPAAVLEVAPRAASRLILVTIVAVQASWLSLLGYFGSKLLA